MLLKEDLIKTHVHYFLYKDNYRLVNDFLLAKLYNENDRFH